MPPSSLAQVTSLEKNKTGNKVNKHTPEDSILKTLKRRRNGTKEASNWYDEKLAKEDIAERLVFYESIEIDKKKETEDTDSDYEEERSDESETCSEDDDSHEENSDESETCSEDDDSSSCAKRNYAIRKKAVRKKEESSDESETCSEDDDPDYVKEKYMKEKKATVLSSYEKMAEQNKAERLAFLKSLKIDEVTADFSKAVKKKVKSEPARRILKKKEDLTQRLPTRQSKRLANVDVDVDPPSPKFSESENELLYFIPSEMTFSHALDPGKKYESYAEDISIQEINSTEKHFSYDRSIVQSLTLKDSNIAKIVPQRIRSMSWYPSADNLILAAGNSEGNIGIWNVDSKSCPYTFKIHTAGITCLQFNPFDPTQLVSSSNDCILRSGDMIKHKFSEKQVLCYGDLHKLQLLPLEQRCMDFPIMELSGPIYEA